MRNFLFALIILSVAGPCRALADQIQYLALPQESLAAFARVIDGAKSSIELATFIYQPCDPSVRLLTEKLAAKARAGVHVRVLIDALQESVSQRANIENEFAKEGIDFRLYSNRLLEINLRMHTKFLVVDGQTYLMGGRNLADNYFDLSPDLNYVDRDVLVNGPSVQEASAYFEELWNSDMVSKSQGQADHFTDWNDFCATDLDPAIHRLQAYLQTHENFLLNAVPVRSCEMHFTADNPDFFKAEYGPSWNQGKGLATFMTSARLDRKLATLSVLNFLAGAQQNLVFENQNYIPVTQLNDAFAQLRARQIPMQLLVNQDGDDGPVLLLEAEEYDMLRSQKHDSVGSQWIGQISSQGSLGTPFELTPSGSRFFMHSKVVARDGRDLLIGSFNLDSRSANINLETAATILNCPELVQDMMTHYQDVHAQYEQDQRQNLPKPNPNPIEKVLGDLLLPEI